ncbi:peptidylprolyl isomerase [Salinithrix halophila]|uniref:Peptidylprolyl isomerase n=1 Tax=Salinithrix halophila TaxID=1485204 RepID=A0ABV8JCJ9_9BACL
MRPINRRLLTALSALLAVSVLVAGCGSGGDKKDNADKQAKEAAGQAKPLPTDSKKVVAEYKGGKVTEGELNLYLNIFSFFQPQMAAMVNNPEAKKEIVKQYVAEKMIAGRVKDNEKYTKEANKALKDFEKQLEQMPAQGKDKKKQDMDSVLKENGITKTQLKEFLENNNKVSNYFEDKVKESDLKKEYEKSDAYYSIKLNHILIAFEPQGKDGKPDKKNKRSDKEAKKRAEEVKKKLDEGGKFKDLSKKYSDDPGSKNKGGEIQDSPQNWVPQFAKAAKELPLNKISDPVKTEYGYHVMKVTDRGKQPYKKVKDQIKGQKVQEKYQNFIKNEVKIKKLNIPGDKKKK